MANKVCNEIDGGEQNGGENLSEVNKKKWHLPEFANIPVREMANKVCNEIDGGAQNGGENLPEGNKKI